MKVKLQLPVTGVEEALVEMMTDWCQKNMLDPDEWEEQFDNAALRLTDIIGEEPEIEVEFDLVKGTARMLLDRCPKIKFKPGQMYRPDFAEVGEFDLLHEDSIFS